MMVVQNNLSFHNLSSIWKEILNIKWKTVNLSIWIMKIIEGYDQLIFDIYTYMYYL